MVDQRRAYISNSSTSIVISTGGKKYMKRYSVSSLTPCRVLSTHSQLSCLNELNQCEDVFLKIRLVSTKNHEKLRVKYLKVVQIREQQ